MPKGTQKVHFSFDERHITHFGGMWLIQRFCKKIKLKKLLQEHVRFVQRNQGYRTCELLLALMFAIIMGLRRINKTEILQYNGAFLEMLGLTRFPDQSTLRRFLKRLPPKKIRQLVRLHDSLRAHLFGLPRRRTTLIFDLDSVVLVVYGQPERASVGYNPKKPGRLSYHPLLCFEAHFQEFWHGSLRPGRAATSTGVIPFLKICLAKIPTGIARSRVRFRMDAGFYRSRVIQFLDGTGCGYVVVAKKRRLLKMKAQACKFHRLRFGWEVGEFWEKIHPNVDKKHRFIVVRRPIPPDPLEAKQLTLFKDQKYVYHVFITNLPLTAWRVYQFYQRRAAVEKGVRELLYDYPLGKIPTGTWTANVAFFQILLFAANVVHWFKRLCLPKEYRTATLDTIRTDFIVLPARLVREHKKNVVKLPDDYHYQKEFLDAAKNVEHLRLPRKFRFCNKARASFPFK